MNPQYEILAKCLLPEHMLEWFELTRVEIKPREKKSAQDQQSEEYSPNVILLYLDENDLTPENREDLRPNGFTPEKTFHDFPIRGQEVLLHVRRRRWLDAAGRNVMSEFDFIQESTRLSNKDAHGRRGCLVAIVKGTKAKEVTDVLKKRPQAGRGGNTGLL